MSINAQLSQLPPGLLFDELAEIQGSDAWEARRALTFNASETRAMMGFGGRIELLNYKKTGVAKEFADYVEEKIFPKGHQFEAWARPLAAVYAQEDLTTATLARQIAGMPMAVSLDGISESALDEANRTDRLRGIIWEHKQLNKELREAMENDEIPEKYWWQMEQGLLIANLSRALFTASDWDEDGNCLEIYHVWYKASRDKAQQLIAGWKQFAADLETHEYTPPAPPKPTAAPVDFLPTVFVKATGAITQSNLAEAGGQIRAFIKGVNEDLNTDQDFVDCDAIAKSLRKGAKSIGSAKEQMLAGAADIGAAAYIMDELAKEMNAKALRLEKLYRTEQERRKQELCSEFEYRLINHVAAQNKRLSDPNLALPPESTHLQAAAVIKGLRSVDSMREKLDAALAKAKINASALADQACANLAWLSDTPHQHLMPDLKDWVFRPVDIFQGQIALRLQKYEADMQRQREEEKARVVQEAEQAKAEREELLMQQQSKIQLPPDSEPLGVEEEKNIQDAVFDEPPGEDNAGPETHCFTEGHMLEQVDYYLDTLELKPRTRNTAATHIRGFVHHLIRKDS